MTARILLIGASGQVGWELRRTLRPLGQVVAASRSGKFGPRVDLARPGDLARLFDVARPDVVVNAAAYTVVDRAEMVPHGVGKALAIARQAAWRILSCSEMLHGRVSHKTACRANPVCPERALALA